MRWPLVRLPDAFSGVMVEPTANPRSAQWVARSPLCCDKTLPAPRARFPTVAVSLAVLACILATGCSDQAAPAWSGYVEAEYVYVAAPIAGSLTNLTVTAGQQVGRGDALFSLDAEAETAVRDEAAARLKAAQAQSDDATKGRRAEELAVTQAQLAQARAQAELAVADLARQRQLNDQDFVARARVDDAQAAVTQTQARVAELQAALSVGRLPARSDDRVAAQSQVDAARQALRQTEWRLHQKVQAAPVAAQVNDTYFRPGEFVAAGQPVLSLLAPGQIKARFFVPEADVATLAPGQTVNLNCDGCGAAIPAHIRRIASQAEYTPPVIYSNSQRAKLVFMVEAWPEPADASRLRPGQPVDVRRAGSAASGANPVPSASGTRP
jgi:HlyD family secretion protein